QGGMQRPQPPLLLGTPPTAQSIAFHGLTQPHSEDAESQAWPTRGTESSTWVRVYQEEFFRDSRQSPSCDHVRRWGWSRHAASAPTPEPSGADQVLTSGRGDR